MAVIQVQVETEAGVANFPVDLDFGQISLQESVLLEELLPPDVFSTLMGNDNALTDGSVQMTPTLLRAMLYAKLKRQLPSIEVDSFDLDLGALAGHLPA